MRPLPLINDTYGYLIVRHQTDCQEQCNLGWGPPLFQQHVGAFDFVPIDPSNHSLCVNAPAVLLNGFRLDGGSGRQAGTYSWDQELVLENQL